MFRSQFSVYQRQINLSEEERIALLELWRNRDAKPEITGWWNVKATVTTSSELADAISQVPTGGMGIITIPGGTELVLDRDIAINNKFVLISGDSSNYSKIKFGAHQVDDSHYDYHRFVLGYSAHIRFHYIDFELDTPIDNLDPKTDGLIKALYSQNCSVVLGACNLTLDGTQSFIQSSAYGTALAVGIYSSSITTNGSYVIYNTYRPCVLVKNGITIDDSEKWVSDPNYLIS